MELLFLRSSCGFYLIVVRLIFVPPTRQGHGKGNGMPPPINNLSHHQPDDSYSSTWTLQGLTITFQSPSENNKFTSRSSFPLSSTANCYLLVMVVRYTVDFSGLGTSIKLLVPIEPQTPISKLLLDVQRRLRNHDIHVVAEHLRIQLNRANGPYLDPSDLVADTILDPVQEGFFVTISSTDGKKRAYVEKLDHASSPLVGASPDHETGGLQDRALSPMLAQQQKDPASSAALPKRLPTDSSLRKLKQTIARHLGLSHSAATSDKGPG
jgi:hypothetical protein